MRVPTTVSFVETPTVGSLKQATQEKLSPRWLRLRQWIERTARIVNGNIDFGNPTSGPENIAGAWITVTTPGVANTDFTITHNLGRAAAGYLIMTKSAACDIYTSPTTNGSPTTQLILRANATGVSLTIFVI